MALAKVTGGSGVSLEVKMDSAAVFIHPESLVAPPSPPVRGTVVVTLPRQRTIRALYIVLTAKLVFPGHKDSGLPKAEKVTLELKDDLLPPGEESELVAGEHSYPFSFYPPSNLQIGQGADLNTGIKFPLGRILHYLEALVELVPLPGLLAGLASSTIKSPLKRIWIAALPNNPGDAVDPLNLSLEHFSQTLGPLRMEFFSPNLTLGAPALLTLHFAGPPSSLELLRIKTYLHESVVMYHPTLLLSEPYTTSSTISTTHIDYSGSSPSLVKEWAERKVLEEGKGWKFEDLMRLPVCRTMWPSSRGAEGIYVLRHKLVVEVYYGVPGQTMTKVVKIEAPVVVSSCVCLMESLLLPSYLPVAPKPSIKQIHYPGVLCMCDYSLDEIAPLLRHVSNGSPAAPIVAEAVRVPVKEARVDSNAGLGPGSAV